MERVAPPGIARRGAYGPIRKTGGRVILSEILAFRKIVINLLYGDKAASPFIVERMREVIEGRFQEKLRKAAERLHAVVTARRSSLER